MQLGRLGLALLIALLCLIAYGRAQTLPLISDDYLQIELAREYGPMAHWSALAEDALYRCRATSLLLTHWTEQMFGLESRWLNLSSLLVHVLNCGLVVLLGSWRRIGYSLSIPAACAFAVLQRPHEAVIWYSALPELLVFTFTILALLAWIRHVDSGDWGWLAGSMVAFGLALLSKESGVVFVPLAALVAGWQWRLWVRLVPAGLVCVWYFLGIHGAKADHLHFNDGTFSLAAPFWRAEVNSIWRLLDVWGLVAIAMIGFWRRSGNLIAMSLVWMVVAFLPYSFLTYQSLAPSRHAYLAGVGAALLLAAAFTTLTERFSSRRWIAGLLAVGFLVQQVSYVWTYKHQQFVRRAEPTERLVAAVADYSGPVQVDCFPYPRQIAAVTLSVRTKRRTWLAEKGDTAARQVNLCEISPIVGNGS